MSSPNKTNICFDCKNAVPDNNGHGCAWSRKFEPVEGWTAKPVILRSGGCAPTETYHITACPEFDPDYRKIIHVRCIETGEVYSSLSKAAKAVGGRGDTIGDGIKRGTNFAYGYHWEYVEVDDV